MSYFIDPAVLRALIAEPKYLDPDIVRIEAAVRPDLFGQDALFVRVVLSDRFPLSLRSRTSAARLQRISDAVQRRVVENGVGLFALVTFVGASEASLSARRRSA